MTQPTGAKRVVGCLRRIVRIAHTFVCLSALERHSRSEFIIIVTLNIAYKHVIYTRRHTPSDTHMCVSVCVENLNSSQFAMHASRI